VVHLPQILERRARIEQRSYVARSCLGAWFAVALHAAACCPPLDPEEPVSPHVRARTIPPAVLSRFERPDPTKLPRTDVPKREMIQEPPLVPEAGPKVESDVTRRQTFEPRPLSGPPLDTLPDDVVLKLLETGRAAFVRCFKKAVANDPTTLSFKVKVHVELDGGGAILRANADTTDTALAECLVRSLGWLRFPASGRDVAVELPLFYRAE